KPERIRPAGEFPASHVTSKAGEDVIDAASLPAHPAVDAGTATALAAYLMTLKANAELITNSPYQDGAIALRMGQMNFGKFKGCDGCHQDAPGYGGVSGPVLYNAWQRLTPAFIASFIKDPVAWDTHTLMPHIEMNDDAVNKLAHYLKAIGEEQP